jgi:hypothetical protein
MSGLQGAFETILVSLHKLSEFTAHSRLVGVRAWVAAELGQKAGPAHGLHGGAGAASTGIRQFDSAGMVRILALADGG